MKGEFLLKNEFKNWLTETSKTSEESAKSYLSYVSGADKLISVSKKGGNEKFSLFTILQQELKNQNVEAIEEVILFVISELSRENAEEIFGKPKKTLQNYKSGLYAYLEFFTEYPIFTEHDKECEDTTEESQIEDLLIFTDTGKSLLESSSDAVFSKIDLERNFSLRIKTQDRFYENIFFPIRFITRVFSIKKERNAFKNWLNNLLNSITIFLEENKITFSEITLLTISDNKVYITHKGIKKLAYTKLSDNKTLIPFDVSELKKIAIDHDRSLFDVMNDNLNDLPTIFQITNELKKHIRGNVTYKKLSKVSHSNSLDQFIQGINTQNLLNELELISSKTNLQLMDSSQNTSKGKN